MQSGPFSILRIHHVMMIKQKLKQPVIHSSFNDPIFTLAYLKPYNFCYQPLIHGHITHE